MAYLWDASNYRPRNSYYPLFHVWERRLRSVNWPILLIIAVGLAGIIVEIVR